MISILFTTSEKPMAKLIRWATGEDCSHVAILWDETVVHSNWKGVHSEHTSEFLKENRVVHTIPVSEDSQEDVDRFLRVLSQPNRSPYDFGALLFCGIMLFSRKALGLTKWPKQNLWQSSGMYLCTEFVTEYLYGESDALITPHKLYERILENGR